MSYAASAARQQLIDTVAEAVDEIGVALAALGDAYEQLDEQSADRLEEQLFRPVQVAYGRLQRTYTAFAARSGLKTRAFQPRSGMAAPPAVPELVERATEAVAAADEGLAELQDSLAPVEVGDPELRAGLAEVRRLLAELSVRARDFMRLFGR